MPSGQNTNSANQGGSEDQVLSQAIDVFNQGKGAQQGQQGQNSSSAQGDGSYGDNSVLGQTAGNNPASGSAADTANGATSGTAGEAGKDAVLQAEQACANETGADYTACVDAALAAGGGSGQQADKSGQEGSSGAGSKETGTTAGAEGAGAAGQDQNGTAATAMGGAGAGQQQGTSGGGMGNGSAGGTTSNGSGGYAGGGGNYSGSGNYVNGSGGGARTTAEQVGALDKKLNRQLGVFDGMIQDKQKTIISEREENARASGQNGSDTAGSGNSASGKTAPLLTAMARGSTQSNAGGGNMPDQPGDNRKGDFGADPKQQANIPADIPDGSDDDVVAKQLREAAMKEKDPVLRKKLWDEYRKYKKGVALVK